METKKGIILFIHRTRGFGFIKQADGTNIYFHATAVCKTNFEDLKEGTAVSYMSTDSPKGPKAIGVTIT